MSGTNSTIECLKSRRSVRSYKPDMLPKEVSRRSLRLVHGCQLV